MLSESIFVYGMSQRPIATSATGPPSPYKEWKEVAEQFERVARSGLALNVDYSFEKWSEFQQALADLPEDALGG